MLRTDTLANGGVYHAPTVFQLNEMVDHLAQWTERGAELHRLDLSGHVWTPGEPV